MEMHLSLMVVRFWEPFLLTSVILEMVVHLQPFFFYLHGQSTAEPTQALLLPLEREAAGPIQNRGPPAAISPAPPAVPLAWPFPTQAGSAPGPGLIGPHQSLLRPASREDGADSVSPQLGGPSLGNA